MLGALMGTRLVSSAVKEPRIVMVVACLLLPVAALLLYGMDRIEERLPGKPQTSRDARTRPLRLIRGGADDVAHAQTERDRRLDAS
ncbi:hypothetical protein [Streptomyces sp. NPDC050564]|uniref:hypothetical protein n=1 Tax=Streptomyces sp. NPDC050564 TaxID=3365631 RepID=UPI003788D1E7